MRLYLIRHGIAADSSDGMSDDIRPLTPEGAKKFKHIASGLLEVPADITHVVSSPLVRAVQTAEILRDVFLHATDRDINFRIDESLAPPGKLPAFLASLRDLPPNAAVAAVGHEPILSQWLGQLCFGAAGRCQMKRGAVAAVEVVENHGELLWLMQPRHLRAME